MLCSRPCQSSGFSFSLQLARFTLLPTPVSGPPKQKLQTWAQATVFHQKAEQPESQRTSGSGQLVVPPVAPTGHARLRRHAVSDRMWNWGADGAAAYCHVDRKSNTHRQGSTPSRYRKHQSKRLSETGSHAGRCARPMEENCLLEWHSPTGVFNTL